jgi:hypothetical protein
LLKLQLADTPDDPRLRHGGLVCYFALLWPHDRSDINARRSRRSGSWPPLERSSLACFWSS